MTILDPQQIAAYWVGAGGPRSAVITAVAVALAESGGNTEAVSPTDDWGLWQINGATWAQQYGGRHALLNPDINATAAVQISGQGTNFAPWCTMWADPARDCGHGYITAPQLYSAAWNTYPEALAALGGTYPLPTGGSGPMLQKSRSSWSAVTRYLEHTAQVQWAGLQHARRTNLDARRRLPLQRRHRQRTAVGELPRKCR